MKNTLTFDRIKEGLGKLEGMLNERVSFTTQGLEVHLRTLKAKEQRAVMQYVNEALKHYDDVEDSTFALDSTMDFFLVRKVELLAHAIERINEMDFQGFDYIETGETTDSGVPVKLEKHVFLRDILLDFDLSILDVCYQKYAELVEIAEEKARDNVEFRDKYDELAKAQARVDKLKEELGIFDDEEEPEDAEEEAEELLTEESVRNAVFQPIASEEEAQELMKQRKGGPAVKPQEPEADEESPESLNVGGTEFVRLDDPEDPISEEEEAYLREQERLFQERRGERQPLNQTSPQIIQGRRQKVQQRQVVRKSNIDTRNLDVGEGIHGPETLRRPNKKKNK